MIRPAVLSLLILASAAAGTGAQEAVVRVHADRTGADVSRHMTGACIEDVNHEIYGGISTQMIFGEAFQEPPVTSVEGLKLYGDPWVVGDGEVRAPAGDGPKLVLDRELPAGAEVSVKVRFDDAGAGLAGLILKVREAAVGADRFHGYEVSLDPGRQVLLMGRHRNDWRHIGDVSCEVPVGRWVELSVRLTEAGFEARVDGRPVAKYEDEKAPLPAGAVGLRSWQRETSFRDLVVTADGKPEPIPLRAADPDGLGGVSGMWRPVKAGTAAGRLSLETDKPFAGVQSQRIAFEKGEGSFGVENRGLNRQGMGFVAGKPYQGFLWMRSDAPAEVFVAAENIDGSQAYARAKLAVAGPEWKRYDFTLTPAGDDPSGRLAVTLRSPGSVVVGQAFLQPGDWGRFAGLPTRKDVGDGLVDAGVSVMRLGGLMANAPEYRWKMMTGPRDRRPPYKGYWYPHSSNGWGIFEFLGFCEAAKILPVVDINKDETPQDVADLLEYANGPADSPWGRRRAEEGRPEPYGLKYLEVGNEEAVDEEYWTRFKPLAEAAWAKDPDVVLIVGDFEYRKPIADPLNFEGAPRIKSLAAHKKILDLAKEHGRAVWFDVHIWNHDPKEAPPRIEALKSFDAALAKLSPGADYRIAILEENSNGHAVRRAVAHGETVNGLMRMGDRVPIVCTANALQVDGQNDDGWDQGLVFMNPTKAWLQPPAYVTQMIARSYQPTIVEAAVEGADGDLDVTATKAADGSSVVVRVANTGGRPRPGRIDVGGFTPLRDEVTVDELTGPLDATNTAAEPTRIVPVRRAWRRDADGGRYTFPPYSYTILRFE